MKIKQHRALTRDEVYDLFAKAKSGDDDAFKQLVESHLPLVAKIAGSLKSQLPFEDRFQEGVIGLMQAIQRFDLSSGNMLASYAPCWIVKSITTAAMNTFGAVRLPESVFKKRRRMLNSVEKLEATLDHIPTNDELSAETKLSIKELEALGNMFTPHLHFAEFDDSSVLSDESLALTSELPDNVAAMRDDLNRLSENVDRLNEQERFAIIFSFGLGGEQELTQAQLGARLGCSEWSARELEIKTLNKLRRWMRI